MDSAQTSGGSSANMGELDSSMFYNSMDPANMFPHHVTGEEVYGPPPPFGYNKHDPFNMKPFNPDMFAGMFGTPVAQPPVPATLGPNPFTPLLQPLTPAMPMAPGTVAAVGNPMGAMNPLLMASVMSSLTDDSSSYAPGAAPSSSFDAGAAPSSSSTTGGAPDPSSSYYMNPYYSPYGPFPTTYSPYSVYSPYISPYAPYVDPFATAVVPQNPHPTDPNNQYPHPITGSMTEPGPALAGGHNVYDPHNLIGAPPVFSERERALEHNRAALQPQSPYAPYNMHQVEVPRS